MQRTPSVKQWLMILGLCIVLVAPVVHYFLTTSREHPLIPSILHPSKVSTVSDRYSASNELSGYVLKLADTQFLDYITATLNIFDTNALADPKYFKTMQNIKERKSITQIRFVSPKPKSIAILTCFHILYRIKSIWKHQVLPCS